MRVVMMLVVTMSAVSFAGGRDAALADALEQAREVADDVQDTRGSCRKKVAPKVQALVDTLRVAKRDATAANLKAARRLVGSASDAADDACDGSERKRLTKRLSRIEGTLASASGGDEPAEASTAVTPPKLLGDLAAGLGGLFQGGASRSEHTRSAETRSVQKTELINGKPIDDEDDESAQPAPARRGRASDGPKGGEMMATCKRNADCESNVCFVGNGVLGYCTKTCNDDFGCPGLDYECRRPANLNAPQRLCLQARN